MSRLLITGGAGFIGANFTQYWLSRHPDDPVVVLDALTYAGNLHSLAAARSSSGFTFVHGDIRARTLVEALLREHSIDTVVHFAAESHVDRSISSPEAFLETNVVGTHELLEAARRVWLEEGRGTSRCRFHHISTDEVYGSLRPKDPAFTEASPYAPSSPYAASKAASDHLVRAYHRTYGLPVTITSCSNNYGPYQHPEKFVPLCIVNALEGKPLPVYGDGLQVRDWLFVEDHCRAIELVLSSDRDGETYNIGGGDEWTNLDLLRMIARLLDELFIQDPTLGRRFPRCPAGQPGEIESLIVHVPDRPGHDRRYAISNSKIERTLGFRPAQRLESGLRQTLTWYLSNETWWRHVMDGTYGEWILQHYAGIVSF